MHELAETRPGVAAATMAAARAVSRQQARPLQGGLDVGIGQHDAVVASGDLMEVAAIEADIVRAIELQHTLDFRERRAAGRGPAAATIEKPVIADVFVPPAPTPHRPGRAANDLGRLNPADLATDGSQHDLANRHG